MIDGKRSKRGIYGRESLKKKARRKQIKRKNMELKKREVVKKFIR